MENWKKRRLALLWWAFLLLSILATKASPKVITKRLNEEQEIGTLVAELKRDARLADDFNQSTLAAFRFRFLSSPKDSQQYFDLDPGTGVIRTQVRIDRDEICPGSITCDLLLDVAIQPPYFRVLKLSVEVRDENDNVPRFPASVLKATVSESTQPGPFFPVQLAEDPDSPSNGVVRYAIQPNSEIFGLSVTKSDLDGSVQDVQLVLKKDLDREKKDSYQVKVFAYDGGSPPKSGSVTIEIQVTDENDHRPEFERNIYEMEVVENSPAKKALLTVRATDADAGQNGQVSYTFSQKTNSTYGNQFSIDQESGQISMLSPLDYERNHLITLEVLAQDKGVWSAPVLTKVIITVLDVNDNEPAITVSQTSLPEGEGRDDGIQYGHVTEMCDNNTHVIEIVVSDGDSGDAGKVQCLLQTPDKLKNDQFLLVEFYKNEYAIATNGPIDREITDRYELAVICKDHGRPQLTSTLDLVVIVDDLNDNAPVFTQKEYNIKVKENIGPREVFVQVTATDADSGDNGALTYTLRTLDYDARDTFQIDRLSGAIWTTKSLDREKKDNFRFQVVASDGLPEQTDARSSTSLVSIHVTDVNDEIPRFNQARYNFSVYENQLAKTQVGQVMAYDPDLPPGNRFTYHLDQATCPVNLFRINSTSGMITTKAALNREEKESYEFKVMVRDDGLPGSTPESATVSVYVKDENDNPPTIYFPGLGNDTVYIPNTVPVGHIVTSVVARDPDEGDNARLTYVITDGNEHGMFGIDHQTGDLFVNSLLSHYELITFRLFLTVQDAGVPRKTRQASLQIEVSAASHQHAASGQPTNNIRLSFTDTHLAVIVGIIGGCVIIALALVTAVCFVKRRRKSPKNRPNDLGPGSSGTLANVKYVPSGNGMQDDHSVGTGSGPSYMRDSIGLPEDLAPEEGYVIVNCTHPGDPVTSQMAFERRSRLYSPKPDVGKCQQCDEAMTQLHMSCNRAPPLCSAPDYTRFPTTHHRPIYTPIDYNQAIQSEPSAVLPISTPDWTTSHQRLPSFSQWLNSESFHLKQRGQAYNVTDYGTLGRANGIGGRPVNGDLGITHVDSPRGVIVTCHDGTIRATPTVGTRQFGLMGKHVSTPSHATIVSSLALGNETPEVRNHVTLNNTAHLKA